MSKITQLKEKIEEMRSVKIKDNSGEIITIGEKARKEVKGLLVDNAALAIINTVIAMRQRWETTAEPRIKRFQEKFPHITTLQDLRKLIDSMDEREFCKKALGFNRKEKDWWRYILLKELVNAFIQFQHEKGFSSDWDALKDWAKNIDVSNIEEAIIGRIKNCKLATIQNLRLVLGIDTLKPDVHVKNAFKELKLSNEVELAELLSEITGYSCVELDQILFYWDKHGKNSRRNK